ncbi:MAG: GNAT family N-acetyltransferase [Candidatus Thorarchaeota archaeon]
MEFEIRPIDFRKATKEQWTLYHNFRKIWQNEEYPGDPIFDDEKEEVWLQAGYDDFEVFSYYVTKGDSPDDMVAFLRMRYVSDDAPSYPGNEHVMRTLLYVLKDHRRQGIGLELLKRVSECSKEHEKTLIITGTSQEDGRNALRKLGAKEALKTRDARTNLEDIDWAMVEGWEKEGPKRSPNSRLEFYTKIPDEILEDYCKVYTEVFNQAPLDELDRGHTIFTPELWRKQEERAKETGISCFTAMIREENGDISGLTDVYYEPAHAPLLYQALTGVQEKYRGSGKGKWVKAAMLLKIREEMPDIEIITTQTATSNAPMLAINERLGFKIHQEQYNCQVETEKVVGYLKTKK